MSTKRQVLPSNSISESTGSTVVPATSCTTDRSSPASRFSSELLPTFGLPDQRHAPRTAAAGRHLGHRGQRLDAPSSSRSATPRPCIALTGCGSPSPSDHSAAASASTRSLSTLLAARNTGLPDRCSTLGRGLVGGRRADDGVDDEDDRVRGAHRHRRLLGHQLLQALGVGLPAAGVLHDEPPAQPQFAS